MSEDIERQLSAFNRFILLVMVYIILIVVALYLIWGVLVPLMIAVLAPEVAHLHLCSFYSEGYLGRSC